MQRKQKVNLAEEKGVLLRFLILVLLIVAFFVGKTYWHKKQDQALENRLAKQQQTQENVDVDYASSDEVYKSINNPKIQLVDLRNETEFELKHIESSINLPLDQFKEKIDLIKNDRSIIIIESEEDIKGKIVTDHLKNQGLQVKYLKGGLIDYIQNNFPLVGYGNPSNTEDLMKVQSLDAKKVKEKLLQGEILTFVDTRSPIAFKNDKIDGSINIPLEELEAKKSDLPAGKILLYDQDPLRSFRAAVRLFDMGFANNYNCTDDYKTLKKILFEKEANPEDKPPLEEKNQNTP